MPAEGVVRAFRPVQLVSKTLLLSKMAASLQTTRVCVALRATSAPVRAAAAAAPRPASKPLSFSAAVGSVPALRAVAAAPRALRRACATKAAAASGSNLTLPIDLRGAFLGRRS